MSPLGLKMYSAARHVCDRESLEGGWTRGKTQITAFKEAVGKAGTLDQLLKLSVPQLLHL